LVAAMGWQTGKHRHAQLSNSVQQQDDEEDPEEDSPSMKERKRRGRRTSAALFEVLPMLHELDGIQRRISRGRRVRLAMLFIGVVFLLGTLRYLSSRSSSDGVQERSKPAKVVKESNLNRLDMPMRTVAGVRKGMSASFLLPPAFNVFFFERMMPMILFEKTLTQEICE